MTNEDMSFTENNERCIEGFGQKNREGKTGIVL